MLDQPVIGYVAGRFDRKVILPIASLVLAAMLVLAGVLWWTAELYDQSALRDEMRLLETALDSRLESEAEMLYDYAFWDEAYQKLHLSPDATWAQDNIMGWAHEHLGVAMTFVLDPEGHTWLGAVDGAPAPGQAQELLGKVAWAHVTSVRRAAPDRPQAAFASVDGRLAVITASPIGTHTDAVALRPGPASAIVQVSFLDAKDLSELARTYLLPELRVASAEEGGPRYVVAGRDGTPIAALTWRTAAPGRDLLGRVLPVFFLATLGLGLLAWVVLRHARDAAATIARSEQRASHDPLTGLANRRLLDQKVAAAFERLHGDGASLALLYLDLDGFKPVNDTLGHDAGDIVLRETARRLLAVTRTGDTVARIGGDEFVILQVRGAQPAGAVRLADAILAALTAPLQVENQDIHIGASIGIAVATPEVTSPRELIRRADAALYAAKRAGRGTWRCFTPEPPASAGEAVSHRTDDRLPA